MAVRLTCPFCATTITDGDAPRAGECPGCAAPFAGDGSSVHEAVERALLAWGSAEDVALVAAELFRAEPDDPQAQRVITSDEREGFYHWWVFRRAGVDQVQ